MRPNSPSFRLLLAVALGLTSCAGQNWEQVRAQDTPAVYRRFLAEQPRSPHAAEASERIAVLQLERDPTVEALARFQKEHPASQATADLTRRVEARIFEAARAEATPAAYDHFLASFPAGELAARARGNAEYLRAGGFAGRPDALAAFDAAEPDQRLHDRGAAHARRARCAKQRSSGRHPRCASKLQRASERPTASAICSPSAPRGVRSGWHPASSTAQRRHRSPSATMNARRPRTTRTPTCETGVVAETTVSLQRNGDAEPIWTERFSVRIQDADHRVRAVPRSSHDPPPGSGSDSSFRSQAG
jgi:hypothetical protein